MDFTSFNIQEFMAELSSSAPTPGGGGAAALVGAVGTALSSMVGSLTAGNRKYIDVEDKINELKYKCEILQDELIKAIAADAEGFEPLTKAYAMDKGDPDRDKTLQNASIAACTAPIKIMRLCSEGIEIAAEMGDIGSKMAISDVGCSAVILKAALQSAALNVFINTRSIKNVLTASSLNGMCTQMLEQYVPMADQVYESVTRALKK